ARGDGCDNSSGEQARGIGRGGGRSRRFGEIRHHAEDSWKDFGSAVGAGDGSGRGAGGGLAGLSRAGARWDISREGLDLSVARGRAETALQSERQAGFFLSGD